ncbi:hypothetical protein AHiyo8_45970 [Arthrobacter sp. Hiyo8]|nr:hypothetical protein AHiyo8_45970 [Arthrobacter sp. Hiyo8]
MAGTGAKPQQIVGICFPLNGPPNRALFKWDWRPPVLAENQPVLFPGPREPSAGIAIFMNAFCWLLIRSVSPFESTATIPTSIVSRIVLSSVSRSLLAANNCRRA